MNFKKSFMKAVLLLIIGIILYVFAVTGRSVVIRASNIYAARALQIIALVLIGLGVVFGIFISIKYLIKHLKTTSAKAHNDLNKAKMQSDPLQSFIFNAKNYLSEDKSTEFFREKLNTIITQLPELKKQIQDVKATAEKHFGDDVINYTNSVQPLDDLYEGLLKLGSDLVDRLRSFDENRYESKIAELNKAGKFSEAKEYKDILQKNIDYTNGVIDLYDKASLKLDNFSLELSRLSRDDLADSFAALKDLNSVVDSLKTIWNMTR